MEGVKVKYKSSVKDPGTPGILKIMEGKLIFEPDDPKSDSKLEVQSQDIISKKYTKEGSHKFPLFNLMTNKQGTRHIFEFENYRYMHAFRKFITEEEPKKSAEQLSTAESMHENYRYMHAFRKFITEEEPKKSAEQLSTADLELRVKLLRENSELRRFHKELVESKVLTEDEFWAPRKNLLGKDSIGKCKQQVGLKSVMVSGTKPSTDEQTNRVTFNITPEIISQIFSEKPAVRQAFLDYVPSKMTEKDFWTKYFRAEYLYSTKNTAVASVEAADDEVLAVFLKPDEIYARETRQKIRRGDPTIDLVADQADDYTHIMRDRIMDVVGPQNDPFGRSLAQDINRHSTAVLKGRSIDVESKDSRIVAEALTLVKQVRQDTKDFIQERLERLSQVAVMEDLQEPQNFPLEPLSIKDPRDYFESQQGIILDEPRGAGASKINVHEAYGLLKEYISDIRTRGLIDPLIKPEVSFEVSSELTRTISTAKNTIGNNRRYSALDRLPKSIKDEEILHHWLFIQELLRHFWSSYPITTTSLHTKVRKLKDAMFNTYSQLEAMKESVRSDLRHEFSLLVRPMQKALDAAFEHYEADLKRRATKSDGGGSGKRPYGCV